MKFNMFKDYLRAGRINFPTISEDEINDRSKGDALSKGIALLQLTWFIIQIMTRATQGLAISELELSTAALAGLKSVMYIFWWCKPRDVRFPVVIRARVLEERLAGRTENTTCIFPDEEFHLRQLLCTSLVTFLVTLPGRVICALFKFAAAVRALPHALRQYFVKPIGGSELNRYRARGYNGAGILEMEYYTEAHIDSSHIMTRGMSRMQVSKPLIFKNFENH